MTNRFSPTILAVLAGLLPLLATQTVHAQGSTNPKSALEEVKRELTDRTYYLRYRFQPGETVRWKVVHLVTVETKIQGVVETAKTRSISTKSWQVTDVDAQGQITLVHTVEEVNMWQAVSGRPELTYNSRSGEEPPAEYKHVAESVGVPLATITIAPNGKVVDRQNARAQFNPGIGELTIPFPTQAIKIGQTWATEGELSVRQADNQVKRIKTRQLYRLEKVETGVATISMKTQLLTPINDPKVQSQLVQRIKQGEIQFDIDAGRIISQQMDVDETVIGFNGTDSLMKYLSRLSEETVKSAAIAAGPQPPPR
jgi:hypothetical protein